MDLPEPDRQLLDPAPVHRVVCQLRFDTNERAATSEVGRRWAEHLGDSYPRFDQLQGEVITIQGGANQPAPRFGHAQERGWRFSDDEQRTLVTLLPDSLALETADYRGWDDFAAQFEVLLRLLADTVGPAVEQRLGLRYINHLSAGQNAVAEEVDREVLGLRVHPDLAGSILQVEQRAIVQLANRFLASVRFLSAGEDDPAVLDIDVYREAGRPFDVEAARSALDEQNTDALGLFQGCLAESYLDGLRISRGGS